MINKYSDKQVEMYGVTVGELKKILENNKDDDYIMFSFKGVILTKDCVKESLTTPDFKTEKKKKVFTFKVIYMDR